MKTVFEYLDYRAYMKDVYEDRKSESAFYSYRVMAESFGIFPSNLFRILHGDAHLPARCQSRALEVLGLTGRAAEYFQLLITYAREKSSRVRTEILEKALALRDVSRKSLEDRELEYFDHWWVAVVRALLEITKGRAVPRELADLVAPNIGESEVQSALELLEELKLVKKADSGRLLPAQAHLTAGGEAKAKAVHRFQRQILSLAAESLDRFPTAVRDVSSLTLSMDETTFCEIRELIRECRRQIQKLVEDAKTPDRVMHLAIAFFPAAGVKGRNP